MKQNGLLSVEEVAALLREFDDAEGVAFLCAMFDVRVTERWGCIGCRCPVGLLAQRLTGLSVHAGRLAIWAHNGGGSTALPQCATDFIDEYDRGHWPELIEVA